MEYLFPIPTSYEIVDYNFANISFNVVHSMEKRIAIYQKQFNKLYYFQNILLLIIIFLFIKAISNFIFYRNMFKLWLDL